MLDMRVNSIEEIAGRPRKSHRFLCYISSMFVGGETGESN